MFNPLQRSSLRAIIFVIVLLLPGTPYIVSAEEARDALVHFAVLAEARHDAEEAQVRVGAAPPTIDDLRTLSQTPSPSGANRPFPRNHFFRTSPEIVGSTADNYDFETPGYVVGSPPENHDLQADLQETGDKPENHDFETGNFTGWTGTGATIQQDATRGYWAKLSNSNAEIVSDGFDLGSDAQTLAMDIGWLTGSGYSWTKIYILSGANYSTQTEIASIYCFKCGSWERRNFDVSAWAGQSVKLRLWRYFGDLGFDDIQVEDLFPGYRVSGDATRVEMGEEEVSAGLNGTNAYIISPPLTVDSAAQSGELNVKANSAQTDQYKIVILSGQDFATETLVASGSVGDSWESVRFPLSDWIGESIRIKVQRQSGKILVDDIGIQWVDVVNWSGVTGDARIEEEGGDYYLDTDGDLISPQLELDSRAQHILLDYRKGSVTGILVVEVLGGENFDTTIGMYQFVGSTTAWETIRIGVESESDQTIKLKLRSLIGRIHIDNVGIQEQVLEGWELRSQSSNSAIFGDADDNGDFVTHDPSVGLVELQSSAMTTGIIDGAGVDVKYYSISYDIGYATNSSLKVTWVSTGGQTTQVLSHIASTPTGFTTTYFSIADNAGLDGYLRVRLTNGARIYEIADNAIAERLLDPFSAKVGRSVDTATGAYQYRSDDLTSDGLLAATFTRYYNAPTGDPELLGFGWSHVYATSFVQLGTDAVVLWGDGRTFFYKWQSSTQTYKPADRRVYDRLVKNGDGTHTLTTQTKLAHHFDLSGKLTSISDANENALTFAYSGGKLQSITPDGGTALTLGYDLQGRVTSVTDGTRTISYSYDAEGDLVSLNDADGEVWIYTYDEHFLLEVTKPGGQVDIANDYDELGRVEIHSYDQGRTLTFFYDTPGKGATTVVNELGNATTYYFNGTQRNTHIQDPEGGVTGIDLDDLAGVYTFTDKDGNTWILEFDSGGRLISLTDALAQVRTFTYDGDDNLISQSDRRGKVWSYTYDANGNRLTRTDPLGKVWTYTYDAKGNRLTETNPLGHTWTYTHTGSGRVASVTDPLNNTWSYFYGLGGRVTSEVGPLSHLVQYEYSANRLVDIFYGYADHFAFFFDNNGSLERIVDIRRDAGDANSTQYSTYFGLDENGLTTSKTDAEGNVTTYAYDADSNMTSMTDPNNHTTTYTYNELGQLETSTDPLGNSTSYTYDTLGQLASITDPEDRTTQYSFDALGQLLSLTMPNGGVYTFTYDAEGNLLTQTDPLNNTWTNTYDDVGQLLTATDPLNRTTTYAYDDAGQLISITDPLSNVVSFGYDSAGRRTTRTDQAGKVWTTAYDALYRATSETDPLGNTTSYTYDLTDRLTTETDPLNQTTTYEYASSELGRLVKVTTPLGYETSFDYDDIGQLVGATLPNNGSFTFTYDGAGNLLTETDPLNNVWSYSYLATDWLDTVTDPRNNVTNYDYDDAGQLVEVVDALSNTTAATYTDLGQLATLTDPLNNVWSYGYDLNGRRTSVTDPLNQTTNWVYDDVGQLLSETNPASEAVTISYDAAGRPTQVLRPSGNGVSYTWDPRGLPATISDALNNTTTLGYDDAGRRTSLTTPRNNTYSYAYDDAGQLTSMTDPLSGVVSYGYDDDGRQTSVTNANNRTTTRTYDGLGNVLTLTDPLNRTHTATYDLLGQLDTYTDARGTQTSHAYDAVGNLTTITYPGGSLNYSWDALDRLSTMTDALGTTTWTYDANSRVTNVAGPNGAVGYGYDAIGQRTSETLPGGRTIGYTFDAGGRIISVTDWQSQTTQMGYNNDGYRTLITRPNGVATAYGYDLAGRRTSVVHSDLNGPIRSFDYTYDADGNRTAVTSQAGTESYTLDALGRVTGVTYANSDTAGYTYDANGNRLSETFNGNTIATNSYDAADQLVSDGSISYSYDANGNLTAAGADSFAWDWANQLTSATVGGTTSTYTYDGLGLRASATTGGVTTPYLWDYQREIPVIVDDGTNGYIHSGGLLAQIDGLGTTTYPLTDVLGSVRGLTDGAGTLTGTADYEVFGAIRSQTGATTSFGFAGDLRDGVTGFTYLRSRDHDPVTGRFTSADTVQPNAPGTQGYNRYAYVANNPTTWIDPLGREIDPDAATLLDALGLLFTIATILETGVCIVALFGPLGTVCLILTILLVVLIVLIPILECALAPESGCGLGDFAPSSPTQCLVDGTLGALDGLDDNLKKRPGWGGIAKDAILGCVTEGRWPPGPRTKRPDPGNLKIRDDYRQEWLPTLGFDGLIEPGTCLVYEYIEDGVVKYVGITHDFQRRSGEHRRQKGIDIERVEGLPMMSDSDCESVEQRLIECYGLEKDGGTLLNGRNTISPRRPEYPRRVGRGRGILEGFGYWNGEC